MSSTTRKIARNRARSNMKRRGIQHINKRTRTRGLLGVYTQNPSFFANNWRDYIDGGENQPRHRRKTA